MAPTERKSAWASMPSPKPEWETFKRMLPACNNNPEVVQARWLKSRSRWQHLKVTPSAQ
tara:strand:+ start:479 stop:655 length:177 start_codon:yes stop_codon:yes gene_type:complete